MAEKKNVSKASETTVKKSQTKKATTGAWWKSTTIAESVPAEPVEKKTPSRKPRSRKPPQKNTDPGPAKPAAETSTEVVENNMQEQKKEVAANGAYAEKLPLQPVEPSETKGEKEVRKRRPPRRKKPSAASAEQKVSNAADDSGSPLESSDTETNKPSQETETPKKRRTGRKRGRPKKSSAAPAQQKDGDDSAQESSDPSAQDNEQEAPEKRTPRKRSGRRKKSAKPPAEPDTVGETTQLNEKVQIVSQERAEETEAEVIRSLEDAESDNASGDKGKTVKGDAEGEEKSPEKKKEIKAEEPKPVIKLLINAEEPEECRLALLEDGRLESIHVATSTRTQTKNNIYKARIVAIEPNLQAAFVDYGTEKNGFLPFSEIHPEYYKENVSEKVQKFIDQHQWKRLSITDVMEKGREVLVQVVKEEVGKKGANMTTYLSLPGRCVVLMPGSDSTGISRKISGEEKRSQLRDYILSMGIPEGIGWIVRTASNDITKTALSRDVNYLLKLWEDVKKKGQDLDGVGLIYQDHDHVLRFLREHFDPDIQEILVDNEEALEQVAGFIELLPSKQRQVRCKLHRGARPIFNQYSIEDQIESIYQPNVNLPSGGSIVIDPTEALVAIDVNSGSTQKGQNFEDTIFQANMEAAKELARQLRLRDLGGLIVVDFIDMRSKKNIKEVERQVKSAMKRDKAKVDISRISKFGLMQISRQKLGAPIEAGNYRICEHCRGRGTVRSVETLALYYLRRIHTAASRKMVIQIECHFPLDVAQYLLNNKRHELRELENKYNTEVVIIADPSLKPADHEILFHKAEKDESGKKRS